MISAGGTRPNPDKVAPTMSMPAPTNVSEVRCVLGMVNQLAKYSPYLAEFSAPMRELLRKDRA